MGKIERAIYWISIVCLFWAISYWYTEWKFAVAERWCAICSWQKAEEKLKKEYPVGAWIEVDGHAVAVRCGKTVDGVRLIEVLGKDRWHDGEPAPPPAESKTDPRWQMALLPADENGVSKIQPAPILIPRKTKNEKVDFQLELRSASKK